MKKTYIIYHNKWENKHDGTMAVLSSTEELEELYKKLNSSDRDEELVMYITVIDQNGKIDFTGAYEDHEESMNLFNELDKS